MNRRDLIIVAVIINAGLLVTLFVSSLKRDQEPQLARLELPQEQVKNESLAPSPPKGGDPVDQVISHYTAMAKEEEKKEVVLPPPVLAPQPKVEEKAPAKVALKKSPLRVVTVEKGDVLEKIARSHGVSVDEIMKLNHLNNSRLQIGQELKLPEKKLAQKTPPPADKDQDKYYVVKGGDSPWTIAQKNGIKVEDLLRLNNIDEEKAKRLRPGDRLRIK